MYECKVKLKLLNTLSMIEIRETDKVFKGGQPDVAKKVG
jgi:hypothetical protein